MLYRYSVEGIGFIQNCAKVLSHVSGYFSSKSPDFLVVFNITLRNSFSSFLKVFKSFFNILAVFFVFFSPAHFQYSPSTKLLKYESMKHKKDTLLKRGTSFVYLGILLLAACHKAHHLFAFL